MNLRIQSIGISLLTLNFILAIPCAQAQESFYYRKGEKIPLKILPGKSFVLLEESISATSIHSSLEGSNFRALNVAIEEIPKGLNLSPDFQPLQRRWAIVENAPAAGLDAAARAAPMDLAELRSDVVYQAPFVETPGGKEVGFSHLVLVKLKDADNEEILKQHAEELNVRIVGQNKYLPRWYTLECTKNSQGNALQVANKLYETGLFSSAQPDFLNNYRPQANDIHFSRQWGLKNTGQHGSSSSGADIGAEDLWNLTQGDASVVVAVVDHGIDVPHDDLPNISGFSFDTVTGGPGQVRGNHGTACAGIIGAASNNQIGVAGVTPGVTLMSISDPLLVTPNASQQLANGISVAWQNGADVISNSWGHDQLAMDILDDAIETAMTDGRNGLGAVVVFAAGNENNGVVGYPARSHPDIITVGAMSPCGARKNNLSCDNETWWGSNYGDALDVVAPGVLIPTTDRPGSAGYDTGDYALNFNGTSSACPHVAGIAAAMLSVNPSLTQRQVGEIIEKTARKVGTYQYQTVPGRGQGTWHREMGYGLVNAPEAVRAAQSQTGSALTRKEPE